MGSGSNREGDKAVTVEVATSSTSEATPARRGERWRAFAELARVSNLPTVWTNTLTGVAIAALAREHGLTGEGQAAAQTGGAFPWLTAALVALAMSLFYIAGMVMNDAIDIEVDRRERPSRSMPSGRVSAREAWLLIVICFIIGFAALALTTIAAVVAGAALIATISLYNVIHQRAAASVALMGACRGLVYITAALAIPLDDPTTAYWQDLAIFAATITAYTILITIIARGETQQGLDARRWLAILFPLIALTPVFAAREGPPEFAFPLGGIVITWLLWVALNVIGRRGPTVRAIMALLAGMCLLDSFYLSLLDQSSAAGVAIALFFVTLIGHRRILGS